MNTFFQICFYSVLPNCSLGNRARTLSHDGSVGGSQLSPWNSPSAGGICDLQAYTCFCRGWGTAPLQWMVGRVAYKGLCLLFGQFWRSIPAAQLLSGISWRLYGNCIPVWLLSLCSPASFTPQWLWRPRAVLCHHCAGSPLPQSLLLREPEGEERRGEVRKRLCLVYMSTFCEFCNVWRVFISKRPI